MERLAKTLLLVSTEYDEAYGRWRKLPYTVIDRFPVSEVGRQVPGVRRLALHSTFAEQTHFTMEIKSQPAAKRLAFVRKSGNKTGSQ